MENDICQVTETVWTSVLGLNVRRAPGDDGIGDRRSVVGCVYISGAYEGAVTLESSPTLLRRASAILLGVAEGETSDDEMRDTLGELINIIGGNIKGLLPQPSKLSVPAVVDGRELKLDIQNTHTVSGVIFECEGEPVRVTLHKRNQA